jgi:anti-sigma regulatory factor (Ser/Thr protein kinase)
LIARARPSLAEARWLQGLSPIPMLDGASASLVREAVREVAAAQGLDAARSGAIVTAASELATNQLNHARGGAIAVRPVARGPVLGVEVIAADEGPGLADVAAALVGGVPSRTGLGVGLASARRLSAEMDVDVRVGEGSCFWIRSFAGAVFHRPEVGIYSTPHPDESLCGDDAAFVRGATDLRLAVADGLGHGPEARAAATVAIEAFLAATGDDLVATLEAAGRAATGSRGTVMSVVRATDDPRALAHAAVGNIVTHLARGRETARFTGTAAVLGGAGGRVRSRVESAPLGPASVLAIFTDGLTGRLSIDDELLDLPAVSIAQRLHERFVRGNDDALVLVVR